MTQRLIISIQLQRLSLCYQVIWEISRFQKFFIEFLSEIDRFHQGPRSGIIALLDFEGVSFRHLLKPSLSSMKKGVRYLEDVIPVEVKAVHVLNSTKILKLVLGELFS